MVQTLQKMVAIPFMVVILLLVSDASGEYDIIFKKVTNIFKGKLYHKDTPVEDTQSLLQPELYKQVQKDVCQQIIKTVPWYGSIGGISYCMVDIQNNGHISVTYTISATDEFLKSHDPSCSSYDILLDRLVQRNKASGDGYYLKEMKLETGNPAHSKSQSSKHVGSAVISVFGFLWKSGRRLPWDIDIDVEDNVEEASQSAKKQIVQCLNISSANENNIRVRPFGYQIVQYEHIYILGRANITIDKVMLIENRINATCRSFEQLIKYCLESPFNGNNRNYYGKTVEITGENESDIDSNSMVIRVN
ncbi:hypothetical protein EG68_07607 [Paragonimus skrjabini miyazakii]|uniref:SEA domain-containing protein n=1 Tax=Paragonimus skrjabini miyazakii TaxID=59628 RepID=A0A8S9YM63_9TREM|nr:hypothetical protein EG68_07607 [Paragonimus skrjabini miyazakii]